jgi:formylglycine-generating enzyme required for sulfatase activity
MALLLCLGGPARPVFAAEQSVAEFLGMEFVLIPAGQFMMGADPQFTIKSSDGVSAVGDESPRHLVVISKPFYLGVHEVTQEQWETVMDNNFSHFRGQDMPVENVSWEDVQEFIQRLNREAENGRRYRLPTEAEWEYAARAGSAGAYSFGDDSGMLDAHAWYLDNAEGTTHPVGTRAPNAWGLHDMHGNVWEWVADWYGHDYYADAPGTDPAGPPSGQDRVVRGGGWNIFGDLCRSANRDRGAPDSRTDRKGFRLAFTAE